MSVRGFWGTRRGMQWRMLLVTMFCYLFYYTGRQTFGFAIPGIERELGLSKTTLGWASAALLWCYALGQSINGNLADKYGGRYMMAMGAFLSCGLNWIVSLGTGFWSLIVPWAANGYAQSMGWAPGSRVLSNWWEHHERGRVYGLYVLAAGMSSVLTFTTSILIIEFELGWRAIFRLPVLLLLVGGVAFLLIARERPTEEQRVAWGLTTGKEETQDGAAAEVESSRERYLYALSHPRFLIACVAIGFQSLARYGLLVWVPVHFLGDDWKTESKWIAIALPVGMALGALSSGWMSDRLFGANRSRVIVLFLALAGICSASMYFLPTDHWLAIPALFWTGFFAYGPQSAFWALCPDLLGTRRAGTGTGVMNTFAYVFAGLGEPFIGHMIERFEATSMVFAIVAVACGLGATVSLFIRE